MPLDKESINERLEKLSRAIQLLEKYRSVSNEDFLVDFTVNSAAQYNLILGIEIVVDVGAHILSEAYQVRTKEYREVIEFLGRYGVIPEDFAKENEDMARFRNLIIHQYGEVDMRQVYENLKKAPDIFKKFAKHYSEFLEKRDGQHS